MALSEAEQKRIIAQESAWIDDGSFAQLDLSAFPALQPQPPAETHDERFARDWRDTGLSRDASALQQFVSDPDSDALERAGRETGDPNLRDEVRQRKGDLIAQHFKAACPTYVPTQHNFRVITSTLSFNALPPSQQDGDIEDQVAALIDGGHWTVPNLVACFNALTREGLLDVAEGSARNLSERERLHVIRLAQSGNTQGAIDEFLRCALDEDSLSLDIISDPDYRGVIDSSVLFVFESATADYSPSDERRNFLLRYAAGRPLTFPLLNQAWSTLKAREASYARTEILDSFQRRESEPPPSLKQMDELDDEAFDRLYHDTLRSYANSVRQPAGIII
jgi:hypothetical protein